MTMTVAMLQKAFLYVVLLHLWPISLFFKYVFLGRVEGVNPAILLKTAVSFTIQLTGF